MVATKRKRSIMKNRAPYKKRKMGIVYGRYSGRNPEMKSLDTTYTDTLDSTGVVLGTPTGINLVPQGTTDVTRIGRKIIIKNIYIQGWVENPTTTDPGNLYKIALVLDKQANGTYPSYSDIYDVNTDLNSYRNLDNSERFQVIKSWKKHLAVNGVAESTGLKYTKSFSQLNLSHRCNIPIIFDSTTGAITEIRSNNLMLIGICDSSNDTQLNLRCRIRYTDS